MVVETSAARCPTCSEPTLPGDAYCEACGASLPASPAGEAADSPELEAADGIPDLPPGAAPVGDGRLKEPAEPCECGGVFVDGWCDTCGSRQPDPRDHIDDARDDALAGVTDKGLRHHRNEDAMAFERIADGTVYAVVCDGVSTTVDPHVASQAGADAALASLMKTAGDVVAAHRAADDAAAAVQWTPQPDRGPPSTTFATFVLRPDGSATVGSLGDCRSYVLRSDGSAELLTVDDSWAQNQIEAGTMTQREAESHPDAHVITRWMGLDAEPEWQPRLTEVMLSDGDQLMLCSDGVWNYAPGGEDILRVVAERDASTPFERATALVAHALDGGGHDNATIVVAAHTPTIPSHP